MPSTHLPKAAARRGPPLFPVFLAFFAVAVAAPAGAADAVVMRLNFSPWGMHAPYFGGRGQGFYRDEGIDLEMRVMDPLGRPVPIVDGGRPVLELFG